MSIVAAHVDDAAVVDHHVAYIVGGVTRRRALNVHVTPASRLMARPQLVPMNTWFALAGSIAIPKAAGSVRRVSDWQKLTGGVAVAGCVHVVPPSVLTLMPDRLLMRPS
jgi:hypothetical protein